jgi:hypothetical protein
METIHEVAPFIIGLLMPPIAMIAIHAGWSGAAKFALSFATALVLGVATSFFARELAGPLPDALVAVLVDTSLVFTGSQLAYRSFWKPALESRHEEDPEVERVAQRRRR